MTCDADLAHATRLDLWREHLGCDDVDGPPHEIIETIWKPLVEEQLTRRQRGDALTHRLTLLPHVSRRSRRLLGPLQSLIVDG